MNQIHTLVQISASGSILSESLVSIKIVPPSMTASKPPSPQSVLEDIEALTRNPDILKSDDKTRIRLRDAAWKLSLAAEVPGDTIHRTGSLVKSYFSRCTSELYLLINGIH